MARRYSGKKGKSGSKKPSNSDFSWVKYSTAEIEQLVVKLAKTDKPSAEIGSILRDSYGIPDVKKITKKSINQILKEHKLNPELPEDLFSLMKRQMELQKHLTKNKQDQVAKRGLILTKSKIKRLADYYKQKKKLPQNWVFSEERTKLIIG